MNIRLLAGVLLVLLAAAGPALADDAAEIRTRLEGWANAFNEGRVEEACGLFSKELVSDMPGQGEAGYEERCAALARAMRNPDHRFRYTADIKEVIVSGDLAMVRLTWTLTMTPGDLVSQEAGLDVFRKEPDGVWRIIRFMSFEVD
jgi:Ketosteroid isomerase homolog